MVSMANLRVARRATTAEAGEHAAARVRVAPRGAVGVVLDFLANVATAAQAGEEAAANVGVAPRGAILARADILADRTREARIGARVRRAPVPAGRVVWRRLADGAALAELVRRRTRVSVAPVGAEIARGDVVTDSASPARFFLAARILVAPAEARHRRERRREGRRGRQGRLLALARVGLRAALVLAAIEVDRVWASLERLRNLDRVGIRLVETRRLQALFSLRGALFGALADESGSR